MNYLSLEETTDKLDKISERHLSDEDYEVISSAVLYLIKYQEDLVELNDLRDFERYAVNN